MSWVNIYIFKTVTVRRFCNKNNTTLTTNEAGSEQPAQGQNCKENMSMHQSYKDMVSVVVFDFLWDRMLLV